MVKKLASEFLGTFTIVFMGCGGIMVAERFPGTIAPGTIPIVFGLTVTLLIYALGHVSGAHFNPAVTLSFASIGKFPYKSIVPYWVAQCAGAVFSIFLLSYILPQATHYGATTPKVPMVPALIWEFLQTFLLMLVVMGTATDARSQGAMAGVAIGAIVTVDAFIGGPVTGASMNPARSLAPAIWEGQLSTLWIYWTAPMVGAISAAFMYEWLREEPETVGESA